MRPNLISRLKEEWNNLDPVDPLRGLIADAIDALAEQPAQQESEAVRAAWMAGYTEGEREAIEKEQQPAQEEPVAGVVIREGLPTWLQDRHIKPTDQRLYTSPPASKPWVGLTDEEKVELWSENEKHWRFEENLMAFTRAFEAKLRGKNT